MPILRQYEAAIVTNVQKTIPGRILWRLSVGWSHPGFGPWNPDQRSSCIVIHKERLKKQPLKQLNNPHQIRARPIKAHSRASSHAFLPCVVPSRAPTDVQAKPEEAQGHNIKSWSLLFLRRWLPAPFHPWGLSNIWPCFGPD